MRCFKIDPSQPELLDHLDRVIDEVSFDRAADLLILESFEAPQYRRPIGQKFEFLQDVTFERHRLRRVLYRLRSLAKSTVFCGAGDCVDLAWEVALASDYRLWTCPVGTVGWWNDAPLDFLDAAVGKSMEPLYLEGQTVFEVGSANISNMIDFVGPEVLNHDWVASWVSSRPQRRQTSYVEPAPLGELNKCEFLLSLGEPYVRRLHLDRVVDNSDMSVRRPGMSLVADASQRASVIEVEITDQLPPVQSIRRMLRAGFVLDFWASSTDILEQNLAKVRNALARSLEVDEYTKRWASQVVWSPGQGGQTNCLKWLPGDRLEFIFDGSHHSFFLYSGTSRRAPVGYAEPLSDRQLLRKTLKSDLFSRVLDCCATIGNFLEIEWSDPIPMGLWVRALLYEQFKKYAQVRAISVPELIAEAKKGGWTFPDVRYWQALPSLIEENYSVSKSGIESCLQSGCDRVKNLSASVDDSVGLAAARLIPFQRHFNLFLYSVARLLASQISALQTSVDSAVVLSSGVPSDARQLHVEVSSYGRRRLARYSSKWWPELESTDSRVAVVKSTTEF